MAEHLTKEEIEQLYYISEVKIGKFRGGNPVSLFEGLVCKVENGLNSIDYYVPVGDGKFVWSHRN